MLNFIHAQTSSEIYLGIKKLNVLGSVLYVAAHPDDENTRLLAYFSKERLYRTAYLSITRGDGGQNLIGDEQGIELGLIRTQELLSARRIDGAEQYFTRAYDFGYSKTPEETFTKWGRDKILADVVWVIRQSQPDVIITRFPTTGEGGHGHHTASAILANEAFTAAADATRFPEQLKWVKPWQAKKILWNSFNFGGNNTQREDQFKFDVGAYNPVLGKSYGELASESRSQHKSQGFGVPAGRGEAIEFFKSTSGQPPVTDLFDDIKTDWSRIPGGDKISGMINKAIENFDFTQPNKSVPQLVDIHKSLKALSADYWRDKKLKETEQLIESAAGLFLEAFTSEAYIAQTDSLRVNFSLNNRTRTNISLNNIQIDDLDTGFSQPLTHNKNLIFNKTIYVPAHKPITQPYWLEEKMEEGYFNVRDHRKIGQPDVDAAFNVVFNLTIEGQPFSFIKPVKYKFTHPVRGEVYQPVVVVPQVFVNTNPSLVIFRKDNDYSPKVSVITKAAKNLGSQKAQIDLRLKSNHSGIVDSGFTLRKGASKEYDFTVKRTYSLNLDNAVPFVQLNNDTVINYLALQAIHYEHIPDINYFYTDAVKILNIDLKTQGKKIGYIPGAGDRVQQALEIMGFEVSILNNNELSRSNLKQFDAIISGVRAYNTNEWLTTHYDKLMKYVEDGGNLIVQYNTSNQIGPVRARISPYNFTIGRTRITNENAAVTFLIPTHPVLNYPNKIGNDDFKGWIQERSIYHATGWDKNFEPILAMNDPGEKKDSGSLVVAKYGKGFFTYTGLVFFRELPAGVPGAYRLLANLIALNQKKEF
jgi:LmbE family N-acetylglucosaminyl deacetylase